MASRTCPHCNHQYSIGEHFIITFTFRSYNKWNCSNCNALLRSNKNWAMILSIIFGMSLIAFDEFNNQCGVSLEFLLLFFSFCIIMALIFQIFDKYELVQQPFPCHYEHQRKINSSYFPFEIFWTQSDRDVSSLIFLFLSHSIAKKRYDGDLSSIFSQG